MNGLMEVEGSREFIKITSDITLVIDRDPIYKDAGILRFSSGEEISFDWSEDAQRIFSDIDNSNGFEVLMILAQRADDGIKR